MIKLLKSVAGIFALIFISHDLKLVKHVCIKVAVMYKGKIIEIGDITQILTRPKEEYTRKLVGLGLV